MASSSDTAAVIGGALTILALLGAGVANVAAVTVARDSQVCTVEEKDRTKNQDGSSDARVYTSCGVLAVADEPLLLHFDSADTFASLDEGKTYRLDTTGWRVPFLSMFPNIIDAQEVQRG
ncbi:hypothetical protein [Arthrobacter phage SWEP2]|uniref:Uncharacterized protein n=1 Tax=Arthrobacter phage SWEP2 TaxID=2945958 RepID=A0A9E7MJ25_9CAUD|nr:hypothetical protein [Arthrobacter phage SWEP2]